MGDEVTQLFEAATEAPQDLARCPHLPGARRLTPLVPRPYSLPPRGVDIEQGSIEDPTLVRDAP